MQDGGRTKTRVGRLARSIAETAAEDTALWVSFCVFWLWPWLLSNSAARFQESLAGQGVPLFFVLFDRLSLFAFLGSTLLAFAVAYRLHGKRISRGLSPYVVSTSLALASFLALAVFQIGFDDPVVLIGLVAARSLFGGIGIALLCLECGMSFGMIGAHKTLLCGAIATVASAAAAFVLASAPVLVSQIALVLLAVVCAFSLRAVSRKRAALEGGAMSESSSVVSADSVRIPWKLTITTIVWTGSFGAVSAVFEFGSYWSDYGLASYACAAFGLLACMAYLKVSFNDLIYKAGFLVAAAGLALMLYSGTLSPEGYMLFVAGYRFIELLVWGLYAHLIRTRSLSPLWTVSLNVGVWTLGRFFGYLAGYAVLGRPVAAFGEEAFALVLSVELLLLVSALFLSNRNNFVEGWGMERVIDRHRSERQIAYCCDRIASQCDLTLKEREILAYLAKGMSRTEISDELVVSPETTKTHVRHIYRKLGVGSREEILDMIDEEIALSNDC